MSAPDLTPADREALEAALHHIDSSDRGGIPQGFYDRLIALRDACPEPRWLPTEDGLAVYVDSEGFRSVYYVRDGKVGRFLRPDGTLYSPQDPFESGTWEPCTEVTR